MALGRIVRSTGCRARGRQQVESSVPASPSSVASGALMGPYSGHYSINDNNTTTNNKFTNPPAGLANQRPHSMTPR